MVAAQRADGLILKHIREKSGGRVIETTVIRTVEFWPFVITVDHKSRKFACGNKKRNIKDNILFKVQL